MEEITVSGHETKDVVAKTLAEDTVTKKDLESAVVATNSRKSIAIAYLLWFFLGGLGVHRFYLGKKRTAIAILLLTIVGWLTSFFYVGFALLIIAFVWLIVDLFLIPSMVRQYNDQVMTKFRNQIAK